MRLLPAIRTAALLLLIVFASISSRAQNNYTYSVDLTKCDSDELTVNLTCPTITAKEITFYLPKIVPGTYINSNYGKYVHDLKALDAKGKELPVTKTTDNSWNIKKANRVATITYRVEDTWDSKISGYVYPMCGTTFEEGKNFSINTCGLFGYFEGMKQMPFNCSFTKPAGFYAATGLKPVAENGNTETFSCNNVDDLYDSPIMFSVPDTTTIHVANTDVLIAVYSPHHEATSKYIAAHLEKLMMAAKDYLGGKLPVDKYAFLFYFNGDQKINGGGAWEHSYSSFYALGEAPQEQAIEHWVDIASHEFFHIVTPLTISSKEVKQFNFNETVLSKHLWLYEGSTEYYAHHVQEYEGMKTPEQFLQTLSEKIDNSRSRYNDTLPFTELSKESAGKYAVQYGNVYQKGALISACLDIYLRKLSNGAYGLKDLKHDLGIQYGKDKYFDDDSLFNIIGKLTYPEIKDFLNTYVAGPNSIPYEQFFGYAGVQYIPEEKTKQFTIGNINLKPGNDGNIIIRTKNLNDFGKKLGYKDGDELVSINDSAVNIENITDVMQHIYATLHVGDAMKVVVKRKNDAGTLENVTLTAPAEQIDKVQKHILRFMDNPTAEQLKVRNAWLNNYQPAAKTITANPNDVSSIDGIVKALYDVISGPAGDRDWNRFRSLFHSGATMGAITQKKDFRTFTPEQYVIADAPYFKQYAFYEKEIGRTVNRFGNIAQVFTTYEYDFQMSPPEHQRGINSLELVYEKNRWWILSVYWDEENKDNPIPQNYLKMQ